MSITDYLIDSALVLLVLVQIKERPLSTKSLLRPVVIFGIAAANYLHGIPTAGNDLVLIGALSLTGLLIGLASAHTVRMRQGANGEALARAGWVSGFFWVLGMGSRFAFLIWVNNGGAETIGKFSGQHAITGGAAWTAALLLMAAFEVCGRSLLLAARREQLRGVPVPELA